MTTFDQIHRLERNSLNEPERKINKIIEKHIFDCYIHSWITEAEELEDLFGDILLASFIARLAWIKTNGPDKELIKEAREYVKKPVAENHSLRFFTHRHFEKYIQQRKDIEKAPKTDRKMLIKWRTGKRGESGIGYSLTSLLRTESDTAQAEASISTYKAAGVTKYEYCAMKDDKTCDRCKELDGKIFKVSEKQPGVNFPRIHRNCRCYILPILEVGND